MVDRLENGTAAQAPGPDILGGCLGQLLESAGEASGMPALSESDPEIALRVINDLNITTIGDRVSDIVEQERIPLGGFKESRQRHIAQHTVNVIRGLLAEQVEGETHGTSD